MTFGETLERTRRVAAGLAAGGVRKGSLVLIILEHHEDLMPAFLGAMWLGAIPAFLQYPHAKIEPKRYYQNLEGLVQSSIPKAVLTRASVRDSLEAIVPPGPNRPLLMTMEDVSGEKLAGDPEPHGPEDVAAIQYSSGSTGLQKGAMLSHRAILAEIQGVGEFFEINQDDVFLTWVTCNGAEPCFYESHRMFADRFEP